MTPLEQLKLVRTNPAIWLESFGKILDKSRRLIRPKLNVLQRRLIEVYVWCLHNHVPFRCIILKPRQKGSSTGSVGVCYTHLRNFNAAGVFIGDEYVTTDRLLQMFDRYAENDDFTGWGNDYNDVKRKFSHGSELDKETAGDKDAGRGGTYQVILGSEVAHWPNTGTKSASAILLSLLQTQPETANTVTILESTPNGPSGEFYERYKAARSFDEFKDGDTGNGFIKVFAAWFEFDDSTLPCTAAEGEKILGSLTEKERVLMLKYKCTVEHLKWRRWVIGNKVRDEQEFDQEYPTDEETCFIASGNPRFSIEGIYRQERIALSTVPEYGLLEKDELTGTTLSFVQTDRKEAVFQLFEKPVSGCTYLGAFDTMTGASQTAGSRNPDAHSIQIWRRPYTDESDAFHCLRMVASVIPPSRVDPDLAMDFCALLSEYFGWCVVAPEINNSTGIVEGLRARGVPIYKRRRWDRIKTDWATMWGWQTTDPTRRDMIDNLAKWIRSVDENGQPMMECSCPVWINQAKNFIIKPSGKAEAKEGEHDDEIMCSAIAVKCIESAGSTYFDPNKMQPQNWVTAAMNTPLSTIRGGSAEHK